MSEIFNNNKESDSQWISISDMMSGLMVVFLFIAISYMINVIKEKEQIKEIAVTYNRLQNDLYEDLYLEFKNNLKSWNAEIDRQTLSVKFLSPEVLFRQGSAILQPKFKSILRDFFPRYIKIISSSKYKSDIEEIRIEGHTSSEWRINVKSEKAYIYNMELSQNRTRIVLAYVLNLSKIHSDIPWIREHLTANGLSSSKLIKTKNNLEDYNRSRRVEFRVRTNAEKRIVKIIAKSE